MEGNEDPQTPERSQCIKVGDLVHVYNGTSLGTRAYRTTAYIGTVVGYDEEAKKWLVLRCLSCLSYVCVIHVLSSLA